MPENKNQNINPNTSSSSQSTASSSGTSNQNIASSFEKKLELFIEEIKEREKNLPGWLFSLEHSKHLKSEDKKYQEDVIRFSKIRELFNREKFGKKGRNILTGEELEWCSKELIRLDYKLRDYESDKKWKRAGTNEGKEVIKAEISQELEKAKKIFDGFQISQVKHETVKNEIKEKLLELHERKDCEAEIDLVVDRSMFFIDSKEESRKKRQAKAEKVAEAMGKTVMKMVSDTITDLETQKNKISKKIGKLIDARNQEVIEAREIIQALETINQEVKNENADLKDKSDREIKVLHEAIKKLNNELKEFKNKGEQYKKFTQRNIEKIIEKPNLIKEKMTNEEEKLKAENIELKENLKTALNASEFYRLAEEQKTLELKNLQDTLEREKNRLNADLEAKENELERKTKIFLDRQKELTTQIKQLKAEKEKLKKDLDDKDEELEQQQPTINRLRGEESRLNDELKKAKEAKDEIQNKYEALTKKSWFYQVCDKVGIVSLKNSISNASMIVGAVVILYAISWMWKNLVKPTYRNFKGDSENEPQATPTNNNQPPIIQIVRDYPQPQILPQPQEIKTIEVEPPKAVEENFSAVRPDAPEPEPQAETSKTTKNSTKGENNKKTKKKPKNKK